MSSLINPSLSHTPPSTRGYNPAVGVLSNGLLTTTDVQHAFIAATAPSIALAPGKRNSMALRKTPEISLSALIYIFNELIINYNFNQSSNIAVLEKKLNALGYPIGIKALELHSTRSASPAAPETKRFTRVLDVLQYIHTHIWTMLFSKTADNLEKSQDNADEYMIIDNEPPLTKYAKPPKEFDQLNCNAFVAGILEGLLDAAYFSCSVSAHTVPVDGFPMRTVYLIKFSRSVLEREFVRFSR
ncbi:hypothetical protein BABINDRAFT_160739 [Babjeviella inositovora NRRL Y-12698]|uniref:Trafficking protein particle complex subunit n=1 Tax=Babjeviella inositovora NRRL Y-12698 TaxID=984486 RepID=A0A1E3QWE3_9ASCO|nr:uncharacterized protein BABINDRAFT_160739 [Babjeviella inositovora NRRL Y-12698]ODQ81402.1 hypothetical protein BABINDRAFT_160739 [Babjeviella inositovora NRRL Y-12698]